MNRVTGAMPGYSKRSLTEKLGIPSGTPAVVRGEPRLAQGLVDVKVCAVDEVWSGLKFVRRVANRKPQ